MEQCPPPSRSYATVLSSSKVRADDICWQSGLSDFLSMKLSTRWPWSLFLAPSAPVVSSRKHWSIKCAASIPHWMSYMCEALDFSFVCCLFSHRLHYHYSSHCYDWLVQLVYNCSVFGSNGLLFNHLVLSSIPASALYLWICAGLVFQLSCTCKM